MIWLASLVLAKVAPFRTRFRPTETAACKQLASRAKTTKWASLAASSPGELSSDLLSLTAKRKWLAKLERLPQSS